MLDLLPRWLLIGLALALVFPFLFPRLGVVVGGLVVLTGVVMLLMPSNNTSSVIAIVPSCSSSSGGGAFDGILYAFWPHTLLYGLVWFLIGGIRWWDAHQIRVGAMEHG